MGASEGSEPHAHRPRGAAPGGVRAGAGVPGCPFALEHAAMWRLWVLWLAALALLARPALAGPPSLQKARELQADTRTLIDAGQYDDAIERGKKALAARERLLRGNHPDVAESLDTLGEAYVHKNDFAQAEKLLGRALEMRRALFGGEHPEFANTLDKLAAVHLYTGRLKSAEEMYDRVLRIRESELGTGHELVAETLGNLAALYYQQTRYQEAETAFRRALQATEAALGPDAEPVASIASNLGSLYSKLGRLDEADAQYRRALKLYEKHVGKSHTLYANTLNKLGGLALQRNDLVKATKLLEESVAIQEKAVGADHTRVGVALSNLAQVYELRGDLAQAKKAHARAYAILRRLGDRHPHAVQALHNYAFMLAAAGDPAAEPHLFRLVELREAELGRGDVRAADTLLMVAQFALPIRSFAKAKLLAQRVLSVVRPTLGDTHILVAQALAVVGEALAGEKKLKLAVETFQEAVAVAERAYGPRHPELARILMKAAAVSAAHQKSDDAVALARKAADIDERNIREVLAAGSEAQKKAYAGVNARHAHRLVALHRERLPNDVAATRLAMLAILRHKGRVLDVLVDGLGALRRRLTPEDAGLLDKLSAVRSQIATQLVKPPNEQQRLAMEEAEKVASDLERQISERSAAFRADRAPITLEAVQEQIPKGAALVEIFQWQPQRDYRPLPERYLAYVLQQRGEPTWVELGPKDKIDELAAALRRALAEPKSDDYRPLARKLDELVMAPIRKLATGCRQLIVSPDGALNLVPLGALLDGQGRYLIEDRSISYVTSGRDLLRMTSASPARAGDVIIANPDFGAPVVVEPGGGALSRAVFAPLAGTEQEAQALVDLLPHATLHHGPTATKKSVAALRGPRLLHIATHGFFLGDPGGAKPATRALVLGETPAPNQSPLLLSGLAFAGANLRDASGVLTALEAATLDLWGTKLVVLSACETGLGAVESGEGVAGLRRALWTAGAESAVMSLWKVDDNATRDLMIEMYGHLSRDGGRAESLRRAQLSVMAQRQYAHPFYWASFIPVGDYRTLSGRAPAIHVDHGRVEPGPRGCACRTAKSSSTAPAAIALALLAFAMATWRRRGTARPPPARSSAPVPRC